MIIVNYLEVFEYKTILGHGEFLIQADFYMRHNSNAGTQPSEKYYHNRSSDPFFQQQRYVSEFEYFVQYTVNDFLTAVFFGSSDEATYIQPVAL